MYNTPKYNTCVEFGSDKICVLHANITEDGVTEILSFVSKPSKGTVRKGQIFNVDGAIAILREAMDESEIALHSTIDRGEQQVYCLVDGPKTVSRQGSASVQILSSSKKITLMDVQSVTDQASRNIFFTDMQKIASLDGSFVIDDSRREANVVGLIADKLTAHPHFVFAPSKQLETIRKIFDELGFEKPVSLVYSPVAASFAALTTDEREHGALLFDFGYELCSYAFIYQDGVLLSGNIPVGVKNVANDLHVGLSLPYDFCHTFIRENRLTKLRAQGQNFVEYQESNRVRKVPLDSFEKIISLRIRETFELMHKKFETSGLLHTAPNASLVLIGGGALIDSACETMGDIFQLPIRRGGILNTTGLDISQTLPSCCCSAIVGLVKSVSEFGFEQIADNPILDKFSKLGGFAANFIKTVFSKG